MNTKLKIAAGVFAGVIAGTTLLGSAFAAPRSMPFAAFDGYSMMRSAVSSDTFGRPITAEMQAFMDRYRDATGRIDMYRMHTDVVEGRVRSPRHPRVQSPAGRPTRFQGMNITPRGYGMMGGRTAPAQGSGNGMMGGTY